MACISSDLASKRLQLLQEVVPAFSRVSVLFNGGVSAKVEEFREIRATAKTMKIEVQSADMRDPAGFATAFAAIRDGKAQAMLALSEPLTLSHLKEIAEFAAEQHLPSMYGFREFCDAGGLLCYGTNLQHQVRRYGYFIDKILKGTRPGDIPIEEPTIHELIVNARTAKLLGLSIPNSILISADEVGDRVALRPGVARASNARSGVPVQMRTASAFPPTKSACGTFETCRAGLMMSGYRADRKWPAGSQNGAFDPGDIDPIRPSCTISLQ
jgi:ABC transporter substrate binding protein